MADDLTNRLHALIRVVEDVLVAAHGPAHDLAAHHAARGESAPPFRTNSGELTEDEKRDSALALAMRHYGPESPLLRLWVLVRSLEALRAIWTGEAQREAMREAPDPAMTVDPLQAPPPGG